jgi:hypothetical protein
MASIGDEFSSPVLPDGLVTEEKLGHLLALGTEYPELDFKRTLDLSVRRNKDEVELAKDVGAMQVRGGYIVVGVDDDGQPTGELDAGHRQLYDQANLSQKMLRYLPEPLNLATNWFELDGSHAALIYIGPNPDGCAIFRIDGQYAHRTQEGRIEEAFRAGDIFWRDGTRSVRISQEGLRQVFRRRMMREREVWMAEQAALRRQEYAGLQAAYESRQIADAPIGTLGLDLDEETLATATLELVRRTDTIPLRRLMNDAKDRLGSAYESEDWEAELAPLLDRLTCLAATFLEYEIDQWFKEVLDVLAWAYDFGLDDRGQSFDYATGIDQNDERPRLWLMIVERLYGMGGLAVRRERWEAVRELTTTRPPRLERRHYESWLRHGLTMGARSQQLQEQRGDQRVELSLINLAREHVIQLGCLRPDGIHADDEAILNSLVQFDALQGLVCLAQAQEQNDRSAFFTNFARFRTDRVEPVIVRLISDPGMRTVIFPCRTASSHWPCEQWLRWAGTRASVSSQASAASTIRPLLPSSAQIQDRAAIKPLSQYPEQSLTT